MIFWITQKKNADPLLLIRREQIHVGQACDLHATCVYLQVTSFLLKSTNRGQARSGRRDGTLRSCCFPIAVLFHSTAARHRSHYLLPPTQCTTKIKSRLKVLIPDIRNYADSPVSEVTVRSFDGAQDTKLLAQYEVSLPYKFLFKGENSSVLLVTTSPWFCPVS